MTKKSQRLRSKCWFNDCSKSDQATLHLKRNLDFGLPPEELRSGKPIIGIAQTGRDLAQRIRDGVREEGAVLDANQAYYRLHELQGIPRKSH